MQYAISSRAVTVRLKTSGKYNKNPYDLSSGFFIVNEKLSDLIGELF